MTEEQARDAAMKLAWERWEDGLTIQEQYDTVWDAALEYANRWTYCEDALPSEFDWYLVSIVDTNDLGTFRYTDVVCFGHQIESGNTWIVNEAGQKVVAWRPRPEPAKP